MTHLSTAAQHFQESAIRRTGILGAAVPGLISLAAGYPSPDVFPWDDLESITTDLLARRNGNTLQYGATRGYRPLIEQLLAKTLNGRGITAEFEDVVITTGSQQGLDLVGRVLIDPGDVILVELPTYSGAIAAFHNLRGQFAGVSQDAEGIDLAALEAAIASWRERTRRRPSIEWAMIDGVNDSDEQAGKLAPIAYRLRAHVNLIPLKPTPGWPSRPSGTRRVESFVRVLEAGGVNVTVRDTRGRQIDAACGQLRLEHAAG